LLFSIFSLYQELKSTPFHKLKLRKIIVKTFERLRLLGLMKKMFILVLILINHCTYFGEDKYNVKPYNSYFLNKTFKISDPMMYIQCARRECGYVVPRKLSDIQGASWFFNNERDLRATLVVDYLKRGQKVKVINSYELEHKDSSLRFWNSISKILVVEDENGVRSEISEISFKLNVARESKKKSKLELEFDTTEDLIKKEGKALKWFCHFYFQIYKPSKVYSKNKNGSLAKPFTHSYLEMPLAEIMKKKWYGGDPIALKSAIQEIGSEQYSCILLEFKSIEMYYIVNLLLTKAHFILAYYHASDNVMCRFKVKTNYSKNCNKVLRIDELEMSKCLNISSEEMYNYDGSACRRRNP